MISCCLRAWRMGIVRNAALTVIGGAMLMTTGTGALASAHAPAFHSSASSSKGGMVLRLHQRVVRVTIHNFAFVPARLAVSRGTRLVWVNSDADPHTVTADKGGWGSQGLDTGNRYARVFGTTGTFTYHCAIHPFMHGTVVVK